MKTWYAALLLIIVTTPAYAIELGMPVDCEMGTQCVVQNFVDHDALEGDEAYADFKCRKQSYDGHKGTDIRTVNEAVMREGVDILAAADGKVLGARDGVEDGGAVVSGKECGNGIRIEHAGGWTTQYCHMRKGSLRAAAGQQVSKGEVLGKIGLSGDTAFPHLHLQVEHKGKFIDPYTGTHMQQLCADSLQSLWSADAAKQLAYVEGGVLGAGFATHVPIKGEIQKSPPQLTRTTGSDSVLLFWGEFYGLDEGDEVYVALLSPEREVLAEQRDTLPHSRAVQHYYSGKKRADSWPQGMYRGVLRVTRDGQPVIDRSYALEVVR